MKPAAIGLYRFRRLSVAGVGLALSVLTPAEGQLLSWPQATPPDTLPVFELPRPAYDASGFMLGSFLIKPSAIETGSYDDNIFASDLRDVSDYVNTTSEEATIASQWTRHSLSFDLRTDQQVYATHPEESANTYLASVSGRYDINANSFLNLNGIGSQQPDERAAPQALRTNERPTYNRWGGTLSYDERSGSYLEQFQLGVMQIAYINPDYVYASYVAKSIGDRVSYDTGGLFIPFAEVGYIKNDQVFNPDRQSFRNLSGLIGIDAHIPTVLDAEFGAGVLRESFPNPDFNTLVRPVLSMRMLWNVTPLTSVIANVGRTYSGVESFCNSVPPICEIGPTGNVVPIVGPSPLGALFTTHRSTLDATTIKAGVQHEIRHDLLGEADLEYDRDVFDFNNLIDDVYTAEGTLRYLINRHLEVDADYRYRVRTANLPFDFSFNSGPYTENVLSLTVKLAL